MSIDDVMRIFSELLDKPQDKTLMRILADALEDMNDLELATAYRWAADNFKWPAIFEGRNNIGKVYDWDVEGRSSSMSYRPDAEHYKLPKELYDTIRRLPDKEYGEIVQAFRLLGRGLAELDRKAKL